MTKYRVVLMNPQGLRLQVIIPSNRPGQPYDRAEQSINADEDHCRFGPWTAIETERVA